ncbi:hypothetical protein SO694_00073186 [Aureococcus anophagefferens]|uniref:Uncharacterized protein n=1 Tax=Aureococcus anophagefferens TaxID=44056 RepID=A0ABR1FIE8_AURAN
MAAPQKDAAAPRAIVKRWRRRCADEKTTADELLDLAVAALVGDDGGDAAALEAVLAACRAAGLGDGGDVAKLSARLDDLKARRDATDAMDAARESRNPLTLQYAIGKAKAAGVGGSAVREAEALLVALKRSEEAEAKKEERRKDCLAALNGAVVKRDAAALDGRAAQGEPGAKDLALELLRLAASATRSGDDALALALAAGATQLVAALVARGAACPRRRRARRRGAPRGVGRPRRQGVLRRGARRAARRAAEAEAAPSTSSVDVAALGGDARAFWRLRRAPKCRGSTPLHAAAAAGAAPDVLAALLGSAWLAARQPGRPTPAWSRLAAVDGGGRSPLGCALAAGHKGAALWLLGRLEACAPPKPPERAAPRRRRALARARLRPLLPRAGDADPQARRGRGAGLAARRVHGPRRRGARGARGRRARAAARRPPSSAAAARQRLASGAVAGLWAASAPPLLAADRARGALTALGVAASAFGTAPPPFLRSRQALEAAVPLSALPTLKALGVVEAGAVAATLALCHLPPADADDAEEARGDDESASAKKSQRPRRAGGTRNLPPDFDVIYRCDIRSCFESSTSANNWSRIGHIAREFRSSGPGSPVA